MEWMLQVVDELDDMIGAVRLCCTGLRAEIGMPAAGMLGIGGIGAAVAAALLGPLVSLLKGWYLSFWPLLAIALVLFASGAGGALTDFSSKYWHEDPAVVDSGE